MPTDILIVDDSIEILDSVGSALKEKQYIVHIAYNIEDAIETLRIKTIDLMITDINIPGENQFHLLEYTRKMIKYRKMPIILITEEKDEDTLLKAKEYDIEAILPKPIELEKLVGTVTAIIKQIGAIKSRKKRKVSDGIDYKKLKVLVVDDEINITELLKEFLDPFAKDVFTASSAEEAMAVCEKESIDLLISDIKMPEKSGFDLVEWINESPNTAGVPVIMMTGVKKDIDSVKKAKKLWIDKYIIKPFEFEQIKKAIAGICTKDYRREKIKMFEKFYVNLDDDAKKEEQNQVQRMRGQILSIKKEANIARRKLKLLPKDTPQIERYELEQKAVAIEEKAKDFQERVSTIKKDFYNRKKDMVKLIRGLHKRLDQIK